MPCIVGDLRGPRKLLDIVRYEAPERKPAEITASREKNDQQHGKDEARYRIGGDDHARCPYIEKRALPDRLADAERYGHGVRYECQPNAERDRHRHLFDDEIDDRPRAEIAL